MHSRNLSVALRAIPGALIASLLLTTQAFALEYGEWIIGIEYSGSNHGFADGERVQVEGVGAPGDAITQQETFQADLGAGRIVNGEINGGVTLSLSETAFSVELTVSAQTTCEDPEIGTCARSLRHDGDLELFFSVVEDAELHFTGTWEGSDGGGVSLVDFASLELVRLTGNPFNPRELVVVNTNAGEQGVSSGTIDEVVLLEAGETYQLNMRNSTESGDGPDQGSMVFSGTILGADAPVAGAVEDVSLITVICRNLASGQSVTASSPDGSSWNCSDAGLVADSGDRVLQIAVGTVGCESDPCSVGGSTNGVDGLVTVCRNLVSGDSANAQIVDGGWACPLELANGAIALQVVVGDVPAGAAPRFH
ncbi:MAG: hypothetical protein AAF184_21400 [Pseudomonadota bacterium]